jgi:hypothetical protein
MQFASSRNRALADVMSTKYVMVCLHNSSLRSNDQF